jgi:hypothetical protein
MRDNPGGNQNITTCAERQYIEYALQLDRIGHKAGKFHFRVQSLPQMIKLMATMLKDAVFFPKIY